MPGIGSPKIWQQLAGLAKMSETTRQRTMNIALHYIKCEFQQFLLITFRKQSTESVIMAFWNNNAFHLVN